MSKILCNLDFDIHLEQFEIFWNILKLNLQYLFFLPPSYLLNLFISSLYLPLYFLLQPKPFVLGDFLVFFLTTNLPDRLLTMLTNFSPRFLGSFFDQLNKFQTAFLG